MGEESLADTVGLASGFDVGVDLGPPAVEVRHRAVGLEGALVVVDLVENERVVVFDFLGHVEGAAPAPFGD